MQITSGIIAEKTAMSSCVDLGDSIVPADVCYSYDTATPSSNSTPPSTMEVSTVDVHSIAYEETVPFHLDGCHSNAATFPEAAAT
ncbi:unnamed protein product [Strongylus vulgaris]|uniref:Uncharacterized protein n=1 Tax=Strongylus vulgaris TaxID=40348 RepID=A0A3P7IUU6_STRVU|nr:unnamed protein product [Strongylus vulgaris]